MMFQRKLFGRKPIPGAPASQPLPNALGRLTYDSVAERVSLSLIGKDTNSLSWNRTLIARLTELTPRRSVRVAAALCRRNRPNPLA